MRRAEKVTYAVSSPTAGWKIGTDQGWRQSGGVTVMPSARVKESFDYAAAAHSVNEDISWEKNKKILSNLNAYFSVKNVVSRWSETILHTTSINKLTPLKLELFQIKYLFFQTKCLLNA